MPPKRGLKLNQNEGNKSLITTLWSEMGYQLGLPAFLIHFPKYEHLNMKRHGVGLDRTTCSLLFSPRGRTAPWSHGCRLEAVLNLAQKRSGGLFKCRKTGDILFLTPAVVHRILHMPEKEAGGLPVKGAQPLQRIKWKLIYFMHFRGEKRIIWMHWGWSSAQFCSISGLGVGWRTPFPFGASSVVLLHVGLWAQASFSLRN